MRKFIFSPAGQVLIVGAAVAVGYTLLKREAGQVVEAVNPASPDNVFYGAVNGFGEAVTDNENFDLGFWLYDVFNGTGD